MAGPIKIVIAPQALKECLSAWQVAQAIEKGVKRSCSPLKAA